jgi:hypothetical protein
MNIVPSAECIKFITNQLLTTIFTDLLRCPLKDCQFCVHKSGAEVVVSEVECPMQYLCYYIGIGVGAVSWLAASRGNQLKAMTTQECTC